MAEETIDNKVKGNVDSANPSYILQLYEKVKSLESECLVMNGCKAHDIERVCKEHSSKTWELYKEAKNELKKLGADGQRSALEKAVEILKLMDTYCSNTGRCGGYKRSYEMLTDFLEIKLKGDKK